MTKDGDSGIWNGHGVGTPTGDGMGVKFAASVAFQTNSPKLARLNNILVLVEHTAEGDGSAVGAVGVEGLAIHRSLP